MPHGYSRYAVLDSDQKRILEEMGQPLAHRRQYDVTRSPQYQQALDMLGQTGQYAQGLMQPGSEAYQAFAAPEMRQFNEEIMPNIAEQFAGVGGLSSSGFQQQAAQAGSGLAERLAALRANLQFQGAGLQSQLAQQLSNMGMLPYEQRMRMAQLNQNRYAQALGTSRFGLMQKPEGTMHAFGRNFMNNFGRSLGQNAGGMFFGGGGGAGGAGGLTGGSQTPFMQSNNLAMLAATG
jgi:hypothetical protein